MLILGRRREQAVRIGDDVQVVILDVSGGVVKLGISAPSDVTVLRTELLPEEPAHRGAATWRAGPVSGEAGAP